MYINIKIIKPDKILVSVKLTIIVCLTGWTKGMKYYGFEKPGARLVSTSMIRTNEITSDEEITHMVMQWGQFLDHDLDHAIPSTTKESWEGLWKSILNVVVLDRSSLLAVTD